MPDTEGVTRPCASGCLEELRCALGNDLSFRLVLYILLLSVTYLFFLLRAAIDLDDIDREVPAFTGPIPSATSVHADDTRKRPPIAPFLQKTPSAKPREPVPTSPSLGASFQASLCPRLLWLPRTS